eukprot:1750757-Amphidinium_carterae.1
MRLTLTAPRRFRRASSLTSDATTTAFHLGKGSEASKALLFRSHAAGCQRAPSKRWVHHRPYAQGISLRDTKLASKQPCKMQRERWRLPPHKEASSPKR